MHPNLDKLLSLSDHHAARRAQFLAGVAAFTDLGLAGKLFFGRLKIAHSLHHHMLLDLHRPALYCSCHARRQPCLHVLTFLYFLKNQPSLQATAPPAWVKTLNTGSLSTMPRLPSVKSDAARADEKKQRWLHRLAAAEHGFAELAIWLADAVQHGLADALTDDPTFFEKMANRLADASMSGISREMRLLAACVRREIAHDEPWQLLAAVKLGEWHLLGQMFKQRHRLTHHQLADILQKIGIHLKKEEVLAEGQKILDDWVVLHHTIEPVEDALLARRVWLLGLQTRQMAMLLDFKHPASGHDFPFVWASGSILRGNLHFYPSAVPLRAVMTDDITLQSTSATHLSGGFSEIDAFLLHLAEKLSHNPFLISPPNIGFPALFSDVRLRMKGNQLYVVDEQNKTMPVRAERVSAWKMLAFSGGHPISVFGLWQGRFFQIFILSDGIRSLQVN